MPEGLLYRQDVDVQVQGHMLFFVEAKYGARKKENGSYRLSFDTTGGTIHITSSKQSIQRYPANAADHSGLINVTKDGPQGAEIVIPALKVTVHFKHPLGVISLNHIKQLSYYTGMVNSDTFLTWKPGEVLFLGAKGSEGTDSETEVAYDFAMSKNVTGLSVGAIANIAKKGHELAWISYKKDNVDDNAVQKPLGVYIERVYDTTSLSAALGFGG